MFSRVKSPYPKIWTYAANEMLVNMALPRCSIKIMMRTSFNERDPCEGTVRDYPGAVALLCAPCNFNSLMDSCKCVLLRCTGTYLGVRYVLHRRRRKETEILKRRSFNTTPSLGARTPTSMEFTDNRRAIEVWLIAVPKVGWGGFVGPWVPVAITPGKKLCADTRMGLDIAKRLKNVVDAELRIMRARYECSKNELLVESVGPRDEGKKTRKEEGGGRSRRTRNWMMRIQGIGQQNYFYSWDKIC